MDMPTTRTPTSPQYPTPTQSASSLGSSQSATGTTTAIDPFLQSILGDQITHTPANASGHDSSHAASSPPASSSDFASSLPLSPGLGTPTTRTSSHRASSRKNGKRKRVNTPSPLRSSQSAAGTTRTSSHRASSQNPVKKIRLDHHTNTPSPLASSQSASRAGSLPQYPSQAVFEDPFLQYILRDHATPTISSSTLLPIGGSVPVATPKAGIKILDRYRTALTTLREKPEKGHNYVQVLFPNKHAGAANKDCALGTSDPQLTANIQYLKNRGFQKKLLTAIPLMLSHWGLTLKTTPSVSIHILKTVHFNKYINNARGDHNQLRVTRVLECLELFSDATPDGQTLNEILTAVKDILKHRTDSTLSSRRFWKL